MIIEQEIFWSLEISEDNGNITIRNGNDPLHIEEACRKKVALAIHPDLEGEKEEFAVGFAEWIGDSSYWYNGRWLNESDQSNLSTKELIELYKKDNGI